MSAKSGQITATGEYVLGAADKAKAVVSGWIVQLTDNSSNTAAITPKGRAIATQQGDFQAVAYKNMATGLLETGAIVTGDLPYLIWIDAAGMEIELDCTIVSGGVYYDAEPVLG